MFISVCYINIDILSVPISDWIMRIISLPLKVFFKYQNSFSVLITPVAIHKWLRCSLSLIPEAFRCASMKGLRSCTPEGLGKQASFSKHPLVEVIVTDLSNTTLTVSRWKFARYRSLTATALSITHKSKLCDTLPKI